MKKIMFSIVIWMAGAAYCHAAAADVNVAVRQDDTSGYHKFKARAQEQIRENEQKISELKKKKKEDTQEIVEKYNKRVAELEEKNAELRSRIANYDTNKKGQKWDTFRREFDRDMKELGQALNDLGKDNVK